VTQNWTKNNAQEDELAGDTVLNNKFHLHLRLEDHMKRNQGKKNAAGNRKNKGKDVLRARASQKTKPSISKGKPGGRTQTEAKKEPLGVRVGDYKGGTPRRAFRAA